MQRFRSTLLLLLLPCFSKAADTAQDQLDNLASALQKGDSRGAIGIFDPQMASFAELKHDIEALSALPNTYCTITISKTESAGDTIRFETDWSLQTFPEQNGPQVDRRDHVEMTLHLVGDSWKIVALSPMSVLTPPDNAIFKRIADLAADLNDKNGGGALGVFDSRMKLYGEIDNDIDALISQNDILCAIDIVSDRQTGATHTLDLDWYLELKSRADSGPLQRRRERVQVEMEQAGGKWKIGRIDSVKILSPFTN